MAEAIKKAKPHITKITKEIPLPPPLPPSLCEPLDLGTEEREASSDIENSNISLPQDTQTVASGDQTDAKQETAGNANGKGIEDAETGHVEAVQNEAKALNDSSNANCIKNAGSEVTLINQPVQKEAEDSQESTYSAINANCEKDEAAPKSGSKKVSTQRVVDAKVSSQLVESTSSPQPVTVEATCPSFSECSDQLKELARESPVRSHILYPQLAPAAVAHRKIKYMTATREINRMRPMSKDQLMALYPAAELVRNQEYIDHFIKLEKDCSEHEFHILLMNYYNTRNNASNHRNKLNSDERQYHGLKEQVWKFEDASVRKEAVCADGVRCSYVQRTTIAVRDSHISLRLENALDSIHTLVRDLSELAFSEALTRLEIEDYIYTRTSNLLLEFPPNAPVKGYLPQELQPERLHLIRDLKTCISILFSFKRRFAERHSSADAAFNQELIGWLAKMVSVLLRTATLEDHNFLLNHVIRCPAGFEKWALPLIQPPPAPYWPNGLADISACGSPYLNHILVHLATILEPIRGHQEFLSHLKASIKAKFHEEEDPNDEIWAILDVPDNSNSLSLVDISHPWESHTENGIIGLLNQIDFGSVFRHALLISFKDDSNQYDPARMSQSGMFRLLAFCTHLVDLLTKGLELYSQNFLDLSKRLSLLIRNALLYVLDHWQCFKDANPSSSYRVEEPMMLRLQLEIDHLFFRSIRSLFSTSSTLPWQFMADLPYRAVSLQMLWQILWMFYIQDFTIGDDPDTYEEMDFENKLMDPTVKSLFKEKLSGHSEREAHFLLHTLANMAVSRDIEDSSFIVFVTTELFDIAFLHSTLKEAMTKEGSDFLSQVMDRHPSLISLLLQLVKEHLAELGQLALQIFQHISLHRWAPVPTKDLDLIQGWLIETSLSSITNQLARYLLTYLPWGTKDGQPILDYGVHRRAALMVVKACEKMVKDADKASLLEWGLGHLTRAVRDTLFYGSSESGFLSWAWDLLFRLHLHEGPAVSDADPELQPLLGPLDSCQAPACFVALMLTPVGRSVDGWSVKGIDYLLHICEDGQFVAVLHALRYLVPYFCNEPEMLLAHPKFLKVVEDLVNADYLGYLDMAKNLLSHTFPGKVLLKFAALIQTQITGEQAVPCLQLWSRILTHFYWPLRSTRLRDIGYLLGLMVQAALLDPANRLADLTSLLTECVKMPQSTSGAASSRGILSLMSNLLPRQGPREEDFQLVPVGAISDPWLSWLGLVAECLHPYSSDWWRAVLQTMAEDPSLPVAQILKKLMVSHKRSYSANTSSLPLLRWMEKCLTFPLDHPLCPLVWQQFFTFYFQRLSPEGKSLAHHLITNQQRKALKERLNEHGEHHSLLVKKLRDEIAANRNEGIEPPAVNEQALLNKMVFHERLYQYYHTLVRWLVDTRFLQGTLDPEMVPVNYDAGRLYRLIHGDRTHWMEFVDLQQIELCLQELDAQWPPKSGTINFVKSSPTPKSAAECILARLEGHEQPLPPPQLPQLTAPCQEVMEEIFGNPAHLVKTLKLRDLDPFEKQARKFIYQMKSLTHLDRKYLDLVKTEYQNEKKQARCRLHCIRGPDTNEKGCRGGINVIIHYEAYQKNLAQCQMVEKNRTEYNILLGDMKSLPPFEMCSAALHLDHVVKSLKDKHRLMLELKNPGLASRYKDMGTAIFYCLLKMVDNSELCSYLPLRQFLTAVMANLGQDFIEGQEDQSPSLLRAILAQPKSGSLVSSLFQPAVGHTAPGYIALYRMLAEHVPHLSSTDTALVLLSKFRLNSWLREALPTMHQVDALLRTIFGVLKLSRNANPQVASVIVVYRNHLKTLTAHDFPAYYFHILKLIVEGTEQGELTPEIWEDFFTTLGVTPVVLQSFSLLEVCLWLQNFSQRQSLLADPEVQQTIDYLGGYFAHQKATMSRRQTLFTKYQDFLGAFSTFFNLLGHVWVGNALTAHTLGTPRGVWTGLKTLFGPWVEPGPENIWLPVQTADAGKFFVMLGDCVNFYVSNTPEEVRSGMLSLVWEYYCHHFARAPAPVQQASHLMMDLVTWRDFIPSVSNLALMAELLKEKGCVGILANIVCQLPWGQLVLRTPSQRELESVLQLVVGVAWQPAVVQAKSLPQILSQLQQWNWTVVSTHSIGSALQSFLQQANSGVLLGKSNHDLPLLRFLRIVSCVEPDSALQDLRLPLESNPLDKQTCFMDHVGALLARCEKDHPSSLKDGVLQVSWGEAVSQVEQIVNCNVHPQLAFTQATRLLGALLRWLHGQPHLLEATSYWLESNPKSHLLPAILKVSGEILEEPNQTAQLAESVLDSFFSVPRGSGTLMELWEPMLRFSSWDKPEQWWKDLETFAAQYHCHLLQLGLLLRRLQSTPNRLQLANLALLWLRDIQPTEKNEAKLLAMLDFLLELLLRQHHLSSPSTRGNVQPLINSLAIHLEALSLDYEKTSFLGRLGFGSKSPVSPRLRSLAKSLNLLLRVVLGNPGLSAKPVQLLAGGSLDVQTQAKQALLLADSTSLSLGQVRDFLVEQVPPLYPNVAHVQFLGRLRH